MHQKASIATLADHDKKVKKAALQKKYLRLDVTSALIPISESVNEFYRNYISNYYYQLYSKENSKYKFSS